MTGEATREATRQEAAVAPHHARRRDADATGPRTVDVMRKMYWTVRKRPGLARHIVTAMLRGLALGAKVRARRLAVRGKPMVAIGLIEHMGDIAAAEPFARAARQRFPEAHIVWVTRAAYRPLPQAYPEVDETLVVGCLSEWLLLWSLDAFDQVWDLHLTDRRCPLCDTGHVKPGRPGEVNHKTYYGLGTLAQVQEMAAGLDGIDLAPRLAKSDADRAAVDGLGLPETFVAIHAKSNESSRDWDRRKWEALLARLRREHAIHVVEIGTKAEVVQRDDAGQTNLCGRLSMLQTAEVIRRARLFVGIDSGPGHLANAVGTPGVILLGHYNGFRNQMPYSGFYGIGGGATILRADGPVATLDEGDVARAIAERLPPTAYSAGATVDDLHKKGHSA